MRSVFLWLLALGVALSACGGDGSEATTAPSPVERPGPTTVTSAPGSSADTSPELDELDDDARATVEAAVTDLAERTGQDPDAISLASFEYVTWNDGSLGCPRPGEMYTQALVDGSRTVLEVEGVSYHYHAGADGDPFLCETPVGPGAGSTPPPEES